MQQRNVVFDLLKGVAIIFVIVGHSFNVDGRYSRFLETFIFSWHMPLFFIVSGYFYKKVDNKTLILKSWNGLLLPYLVTAFFSVFIYIARHSFSLDSLPTLFLSIIDASGSRAVNSLLSSYPIGAIWFLMAMFWCRLFYNLAFNKMSINMLRCFTVFALIVSTIIGQKVHLPTALLQGLNAIIFFHFGYELKMYGIEKIRIRWVIVVFAIVSDLISIEVGGLSMAKFYYGFLPINVIAASLMFLLLYFVMEELSMKNCPLIKWLEYIGKISIVVLCVHLIQFRNDILLYRMESYIGDWGFYRDAIVVAYKVVVTCLISVLLVRFSIVKRIFNLRW